MAVIHYKTKNASACYAYRKVEGMPTEAEVMERAIQARENAHREIVTLLEKYDKIGLTLKQAIYFLKDRFGDMNG